jgi:hypothetical protein
VIRLRARNFVSGDRGEVVPWLLVLPLIFFVFFFGASYLYLDAARSGAAMAARAGAREYGVLLGQFDPTAASAWATIKVKKVLADEGLLGSSDSLLPPDQPPPNGKRGASVELADYGEWVNCAVTYYLPCPLPGLPKLLPGIARPSNGPWWRSSGHFVFKVAAAAKKEYQYNR